MIWLPGDFPLLLVLFTGIAGVTTALIIGAIAAGAAAAAGGTAYGIQSAVEGNWPWEDPEAWMTGMLRAHTGGLGQVISSATGEPTLSEQVKQVGEGTSREGGTAGVMQGATGQGIGRAISESLTSERETTGPLGNQPAGQTMEQPAGGWVYEHQGHPDMAALGRQGVGSFSTPEAMEQRAVDRWSSGGAMRYDAGDAGEGPSRGDLLKGAWKDIGRGAATSIGGVALGGALGAVAPAAGAFANVAAGGSSTAAPAAAGIVPAVGEAAAGAAPAAAAAPSFLDTARQSLQVIPDTIGHTATGILQQSLLGAGKGAAGAALSGDDPLRGAAMGGAGGIVGGVAGFGAQQFAPAPVPTIQPNPFPMPEIGAPDYVGGMAPGAPTLTSSVASMLPRAASAGASGLVGQLMTPSQPSQPAEPIYSSRPSYYDVYDIGGQNATYGGRRPYWG